MENFRNSTYVRSKTDWIDFPWAVKVKRKLAPFEAVPPG